MRVIAMKRFLRNLLLAAGVAASLMASVFPAYVAMVTGWVKGIDLVLLRVAVAGLFYYGPGLLMIELMAMRRAWKSMISVIYAAMVSFLLLRLFIG